MIICDRKMCTGCGACYNICPVQCILMEYDIEGFLFPIVNESKCINCNKCNEICPSLNEINNTNYNIPITIGCWHKDKDILKRSSSGGAFSAISQYIFENQGIVIGCVIDGTLSPYHTIASNFDELKLMHGSKYLQSEIRSMYNKAKEFLDNNVKVLFTGCPCQIAGLYAYLQGKEYDNLITVDLICHGVGSKKFFDKYIDEMNYRYKDKVTGISFRNKKILGKSYITKLLFNNRSPVYIPAIRDAYMSCYLNKAIYRISCYSCKYASIPRIGDFTIGDFSGIDRNKISRIDYYNGVSVVLLNNQKAKQRFKEFNKYLQWIERPIQEALSTNINIYKPSKLPQSRNEIFNNNITVSEAKDKYCKFKFRVHIANLLGDDITRFLKKIKASMIKD